VVHKRGQVQSARKIKHITAVKRGASPRPIDDPKYFDNDGEFAWVRISDVSASDKYLTKTEQRLSILGSSLSVKQYPNDLFLSIAATVGKPIITKIKCCIHDGFVWFPTIKLNREYLYYLFETGFPFQGLGKLGTQLNLNTDTIGDILIAIPPNTEIRSIVEYIDQETSKIDKLVSIKQKQIELLKEKRAAIITRAVTKGLDPNVPMKDTGIEWLVEMPEHWAILQIRRVIKKFVDYRGKTPDKVCSGIPLITAANVKNGLIDFDNCKEYVKFEDYGEWMGRGLPEIGDVLITTEAPLGEVAQINDTNIALAQRIIMLKANKKLITNEYLKYFIMCGAGNAELVTRSTGSTALGIKAWHLREILILIPPLIDQVEITHIIDSETSKIDRLINKIQSSIEKLQEYRTALISAAVTGKIDVRGE
jgi:type I restriction enzyme S subunit